MSKKDFRQKVKDKLKKESKTQDWKKLIGKLALDIKKETDSAKRLNLITSFKTKHYLNDQHYAELLTSLIKSYQIHLLEEDFKKELKKITNLNSFFNLIY